MFLTDYNLDSDDDPSDNDKYYLIKGAPIAAGGALQVLDGGAKVVVQDGDRLWVKSDTASSLALGFSRRCYQFIGAKMGYVGNQTTTAFTSMAKQDITGDGGTGGAGSRCCKRSRD